MNCTLFQFGKGLFLFLVTFLTAASLSAASTELPPPVFLDPAPADVVVDCYNDRPSQITLRAQTDDGVIDVNPRDSLALGLPTICSGGVVFRIWEISDDEGSAREVQQITFGPSTDGPTIDVTIDLTPDTVECTRVNDPNDELSYSSWLAGKQLAVLSAANPGCAPIVSITDDGPDNLENADCDDMVAVTFTVLDQCNQEASVVFNYVVEDSTPPEFFGDTTDLILECGMAEPPLPNVFATDCGPDPTVVFSTFSTQTNNGSCGDLEYRIERTWTATDNCGNTSIVDQVLNFTDDEQPFFNRPFSLEILCTQDYQDTTLTGSIFNLSDNCTPLDELLVTYSDVVINQPDCNFNFNVRRTWTVTDRCGNRNSQVQNIFVGDNEAPTYTPPATANINCEDVFNFAVVGEPTDLLDNCTATPNVTFEDDRFLEFCANRYRLRRTWRIFDDCGNDDFHVQEIFVTDTVGPTFTTLPTDLVTTCNNEENQDERFNLWVIDLAGARAMDECSPSDSITYEIFTSGTTEYPLLPEFRCDFLDQTVRQLDVDIVATDQCGNRTVVTTSFRQIDTQAPNIFDCPESNVIGTDPGFCGANVGLEPPTIVDQCVTGLPDSHIARDTVQVTSNAAPGDEGTTPVNSVVLNFPITAPLPTNALLPSELIITLENVDGEGTEEFFFILGEDGTVLDSTTRTDVQCATSITNLTLTRLQYNQWAVDGVIQITLEPNIPADQSGGFAVNDLCAGGTRAIGYLRTPIRRLAPLFYEIYINNDAPVLVDPVDTYFTTLDAGLHQITYRVTDCAGNFDECTFTITVEDRIPPVITCPNDVEVDLIGETCNQIIPVPLPSAVVDNCDLFEIQSAQSPAETDRFFTYNFDPNLNTYQANEIIANFLPIAPYTFDTIDVTVRFRGDFDTNNAILEVLDNDGNLLGQSQQGDAGCDEEGTLLIRIPAEEFNEMVIDNDFGLILRPRQIAVPPGQTGDGVNPCDPATITADGQSDGTSYAYAEISYQLLQPDYFTTGATVTPLTSLTAENPIPVLDFNLGVTTINYIIGDPSGNIDTCSFTITLNDPIPPVVTCQPTTIFIDPSGLAPVTIDPSAVNTGTTDNCTLDTVFLTPTTFNCDLIGTTQAVTLTAIDESGNESTCETTVGVTGLAPEPTADSGFCGGDTLFLFANPPSIPAPGQTIYTFRWFNPSGAFISDEENPVIPSVDAGDEGPYRVEITGITGCVSEGVINVNIEDLPLTPAIAAPQSVCIGESIPLSSPTSFNGNVVYQWYEGIPGSGTLIGSSPVPNFAVVPPHGGAGREFYLVALVNGCPSAPSTSVTVTTVVRPQIQGLDDTIISCEFFPVNLRAFDTPNVDFSWTGPNSFSAAGRFVTINSVGPGNDGTYYVSGVVNEGCFTNIDSIELIVTTATPTASLSSNGPVCMGDSLVLTASNDTAATYIFLGPNGTEIQTDTFQLVIPNVTMSSVGDWRVIVNRGDCASLPSAPIAVAINNLPVAQTMILPDPVCAGNDLVLQGSSNVGGSSYSWQGDNDFTSNLIAPVLEDVSQDLSGNYILTVTAPNGCTDTDTLVVDILPGILVTGIEIVDDSCLVGGETIALIANLATLNPNENYSYQWSGPMGISGTNDTLYVPDVTAMNSGSYAVIVTSETGCVSPPAIFTVDFQFSPPPPINPITTDGATGYCLGDNFTISTTDYGPGTTYFWQLPGGSTIVSDTNQITLNAFDVNFSGNYRVRVVREGCSSFFSGPTQISVTLFPELTISANSPVCEGEPINLQVTDLNGATYNWRGPNNFSSSLAGPVIGSANPSLHNGTYRVVATIGGCASDTIETTVFVQPKPRVPVGVPHAPLCISDADASLTLSVNPNTATAGATYQWFINNGTVPISEPSADLDFTLTDFSLFPAGGQVNFFVQTELDGCLSNLSNAVSVRLDLALDNAANAGPDTTICEGLYLLQAGEPEFGTGAWELIEGEGEVFIANPNSALTAVSGMTEFSGPYVFVWSLTNGTCLDYSRDTVVISATSGEVAMAGSDILACLNTDVTLGASPVQEEGSVGTWTQNQAQELLGVTIVEPGNPNTVINGLQPDNVYSFTWTVQSNCGTKSDVVLVNVSDPAPDAGMDVIVCNDDAATVLSASEPTIGSSGRWSAIDPDLTINDPESPTTMVGNLAIGDNLFIWVIDGGTCGIGSADTITVEYKETSSAEDDLISVPFQGTVTFNPLDNDFVPANSSVNFPNAPAQGSLGVLDNGEFEFTAPPNFVGDIVMEYQLLSDGCTTSTATVTLRVGEDADCGAPNIFTPNNDGVNDFFVVPCLLATDLFPNSEVTIFNQWGDEVYRSPRPYRGNWDGRFNGEDLPVGTYFYLIDFGTDRETDSGHVRIQR